MIRYAVKIIDKKGVVRYEAIGIGQSESRQEAHLYTRFDLADKKADQYRKMKQWYLSAEVVEVKMVWPGEPVVVDDVSGSLRDRKASNNFMFDAEPDPVAEECKHTPGKFLGQCQSDKYERYSCAKCGQEFSQRINNQ